MGNMYEEETKKYLLNIFGSSYLVLNNLEELSRNYQELLSIKNQKMECMTAFIAEENPAKKFYLKPWEIDLLLMTSYPGKNDEDMKYYTYFSFRELDFLKLLKSLPSKSSVISEEEIKLLYSFIRNRKSIEELIDSSSTGELALNLEITKILYKLITSRQVTFGHNIKAYERLCHSLDLTNMNPLSKLELKYTNNQDNDF